MPAGLTREGQDLSCRKEEEVKLLHRMCAQPLLQPSVLADEFTHLAYKQVSTGGQAVGVPRSWTILPEFGNSAFRRS